MSYLSLYRKWRPGSFADVLGQAHVTETFVAALREDRVAHAYLFAGPRGTGKTSTARILAKALNCQERTGPEPCGACRRCTEIAEGNSLDVYEMDAASHTSVDDVREIRERIPFASAGGGTKVYIIDEAHQLSNPAFNALLKMLEEPPGHVVFVLCTTEAHKLPATVVSRCQRFEFRRLSPDIVVSHLSSVAEAEKIAATDEALALIARHGKGSVRDALSLLDQAAGTVDGKVTRETVTQILGEAPEDVLLAVADDVGAADLAGVFRRVEALSEQGWDARQLLRQLLDTFRTLFLVARDAADLLAVDPDHLDRLRATAQRFGPAQLEWVLRVLGEAQVDMRLSTHPRLTLEVALARALSAESRSPEAIAARLERLERLMLSGEAPQPAPAAPAATPTPAPAQPAAVPEPAAAPAQEASKQDAQKEAPARQAPVEAPAQPASPTETVAAAPAADAGLDAKWESFLEFVRARKKTTYALVKEGWPLSVDDEFLRVGFANSFHAEAIHKPMHTEHLTAACEHSFGRKLNIRSEVVDGGNPTTAAAQEEARKEEADPVDLVVRGLGAEIVDES